jgi:glutathione S-transferase
MTMVLYTCGQKTAGPAVLHPCGRAGSALEDAGHQFEIKTVAGYRMMPWTWPARRAGRAEVEKLSGTPEVPILVLDDDEVISGSGAIAKWARENPATAG